MQGVLYLLKGGRSAEILETSWCYWSPLRTTVFAAGPDEAGVKSVIQLFQQALDRHDVAAIEALVSPDVVVLENGHRNQGWVDFRDNHLIPEFKEPAAPSKWEFVKVTL